MSGPAPRVLLVHPASRLDAVATVLAACPDAVVLSPPEPGGERGRADAAPPRAAVPYRSAAEAAARAVEEHRRRPFDAVVAVWEGAVETAAELAAALRVPGVPVAAARASRDKSLAAARFTQAGVPHPRTVVFDAGDDPRVVERRLGYPVVTKLPRSTNSHSVLLVRDRRELAAAQERFRRMYARAGNRLFGVYRADAGPGAGERAPRPVVAQEYVPGPEFNIDLLMTLAGHTVLATFEKHPAHGPTFGELQSVYPPALSPGALREVEELAARAVRALGADRGAAHVEVRYGPGGPVVIEAALRPGGFLTPQAIAHLTGVDPHIALVRALATGEPPARPRIPPATACLYGAVNVDRPGRVVRVTGQDRVRELPGVLRFDVVARPGDHLVTLPEGTDYHVARFLLRGATRAEVERTADRIRGRLVVELEEAR